MRFLQKTVLAARKKMYVFFIIFLYKFFDTSGFIATAAAKIPVTAIVSFSLIWQMCTYVLTADWLNVKLSESRCGIFTKLDGNVNVVTDQVNSRVYVMF